MSIAKRRILVASFSREDLSRGQSLSLVAACGLVLIAFAAGWAGSASSQSTAEAAAFGRHLQVVAEDARHGSAEFMTGGAARLERAVAGARQMPPLGAADDVGRRVLAPGLGRSINAADSAASEMRGALANVAEATAGAAEVRRMLSAAAPNLREIAAKAVGSGAPRAAVSAERLLAFLEAGFGLPTIGKIEADLRILVSDVGQGSLAAPAAFAAPAAERAQAVGRKMVTRAQLVQIYESAERALPAAQALRVASMTNSALWWAGAVLLSLLAAVCCVAAAIRGILGEFGRRYHRSVQQFRGSEDSRQRLVQDLRAAVAAGEIETIPVADDDLAEVTGLMNEILERASAAYARTIEATRLAQTDQATATRELAALSDTSEMLSGEMSGAAARARELAGEGGRLDLDAKAAAHAAAEVVSRSGDAARVAQDVYARLEALRDGLQESAKAVKRVGERTQEIDVVVDSLNLLSEQIGVLALNASLEAERAGEAGGGFRLVAKEVQQVSRRCEDAFERIADLVRGAQADARAASASVDKSTGQVVAGSNVGAVSQAFLDALPPLASSAQAMVQQVCERAARSQVAASDLGRMIAEAGERAQSVTAGVRGVQVPLRSGGGHLDRVLAVASHE